MHTTKGVFANYLLSCGLTPTPHSNEHASYINNTMGKHSVSNRSLVRRSASRNGIQIYPQSLTQCLTKIISRSVLRLPCTGTSYLCMQIYFYTTSVSFCDLLALSKHYSGFGEPEFWDGKVVCPAMEPRAVNIVLPYTCHSFTDNYTLIQEGNKLLNGAHRHDPSLRTCQADVLFLRLKLKFTMHITSPLSEHKFIHNPHDDKRSLTTTA